MTLGAAALTDSNKDDLSKADFFSGRNPEFLRMVADFMETETFQAQQVVVAQNDVGHKAYVLRTGSVEILVGAAQKQVAILESGGIFGEMALFGMPKRSATVRCLEDCECQAINHSVFLKALQRFPDERKYFIGLANERKKKLDTFAYNLEQKQKLEQLEQVEQKILQRATDPRHRRMSAPVMSEVLESNQESILSTPFFAGRSPSFVKLLAQFMTHEVFSEGVEIITQGDVGENMYFLYKGKVEVLLAGMPHRIATLESGTFFGEMALFGHPTRTATVRAMQACECRSISHTDFARIVKEFRGEQQYFEDLAAQRRAKLEEAQREQPQDSEHKANVVTLPTPIRLSFSADGEEEAKPAKEAVVEEEPAKVSEPLQSVIGLCDVGKAYLQKPSKLVSLVPSNGTESTGRRSSLANSGSMPSDLPTVMLPPLSARVPAAILNKAPVGSILGKAIHEGQEGPYKGRRRSAA